MARANLFVLASLFFLVSAVYFSAAADAENPAPDSSETDSGGPASELPVCFTSGKGVCIVPSCNNEFDYIGTDSSKCDNYIAKGSLVVMYSKEEISKADGFLFPMDAEGDTFSISANDISCANPLAVKLAYFDFSLKDWAIIPESYAFYVDGQGNMLDDPSAKSEHVMVTAEKIVLQSVEGDILYLAIIENRFPYSETDECIKTNCPWGKTFFTTEEYVIREDGKLVPGYELTFHYCPTVLGCVPNADGLCSPQCPEGIDPDCGKCSPKEGDCCDLSSDKICDMDCPDADPDCLCTDSDDGCCNGKGNDPNCLPDSGKEPVIAEEKFKVNSPGSMIVKSSVSASGSGNIDSRYPDIKIVKDFCNYAIDGACDAKCPSYPIKVELSSSSGSTYATVMRYADADCCSKTKNVIIDGIPKVIKGLEAIESSIDGCCRATCDGVCDPDCLVGQDPDCEPGSAMKLSPEEWASKISSESSGLASGSFFSGSSESKCSGCGNGRCEYNVWGGGRFGRPTIGEGYSFGKYSYFYMGVWQYPPSFADMISHNWHYANEGISRGVTNPLSEKPFMVARFSMNRFVPSPECNECLLGITRFCGYKPLIYARFKADCTEFIFPTSEGSYSTKSYLEGHASDGANTIFDHGRSVLENPIFSNTIAEDMANAFDENYDFKPWVTPYPFDENPANCPSDCGPEKTCPDGICEPWEKETYSCPDDCDSAADYKLSLPLYFLTSHYMKLSEEQKEGYCITKFRTRYEIDSQYIEQEYKGKITDVAKRLNSTIPLCAFAHPGEQGNCPSGSVCGYGCECISMYDFRKIPLVLNETKSAASDNIKEQLSESDAFYSRLSNCADKDLDTFTEGDCYTNKKKDCNDLNSNINPHAFDTCDGIDNDCDGIVDNVPDGDEGSSCDSSLWICKEKEPSFKIQKDNQTNIGCLYEYCHRDKGSPEGRSGKVLFCNYKVGENEPIGLKNYYAYVCDKDNPSDECMPLESSFEVCVNNETGKCNDGRDNDCDGLVDMKDPDCFTCNPSIEAVDRCRLVERKWCSVNPGSGEAELISDGYCGVDACGLVDSSCAEGAEACAEGEKSCGKGCLPGACDIFANRTCNQNGVWVEQGYAEACGQRDADISTSCAPAWTSTGGGACDYVNHYTCKDGSWLGGGQFHCDANDGHRTCGNQYDSDCNSACEPGACDTQRNRYCKVDKSWSASESDYCSNCGYTDSTCGVQPCREGACDYNAQKYCESGAWAATASQEQYCSRCNPNNNPSSVDPNYLCNARPCAKTAETETNCGNGLDEDCDSLMDCQDIDDCPADLEVCINPPCIGGDTKNCNTDVGLCEFGTQTCAGGQWGACTGGKGPLSEICNSFDDDCDESTDEGCGDCGAGEIRACGQNTGLCGTGIQQCNPATGLWSVCYGGSYSAPSSLDICGDGQDNNCDGQMDEGCICIEGATQKCGSATGECKQGNQTCAGSKWGTCTGGKDKLPEICDDMKDNDCDGFTDMADTDCDPSLNNPKKPTCYDTIQNQGETGADCGGPCESCKDTKCNDRKMNGDEEGLDCGGLCPVPCMGAGPSKVKTEEEVSAEPSCGDGSCDEEEDEENCPEDCASVDEASAGSPFTKIIIVILVLGIIAFFGSAIYKNVKAGRKPLDSSSFKSMFSKKPAQPSSPQSLSMQPKQSARQPSMPLSQPMQPAKQGRKKIKSIEDEELDKSFKESEKVFK